MGDMEPGVAMNEEEDDPLRCRKCLNKKKTGIAGDGLCMICWWEATRKK